MNGVTVSEGQQRLEAMLPALDKERAYESRLTPVQSNWASKLGHPCERYLYHMRHDWQKAKPKNLGGLGERGNTLQDWWKYHMVKKGWHLYHDNIPLTDELTRKYQIGGKIDGRISRHDLKPLLYEFKTVPPYYYDKLNTYDDFVNSKSEFLRMYPAQLQIYLLSAGEEAGIFVICNPLTFDWKPIGVYLDFTYTEWLLQRADRVNKANVAGIPPDRIPYGKMCRRCDFADICLPDIMNEGGFEMVENDYLEGLLDEEAKLRPAHERFAEVYDEARDTAKAYKRDFILGTKYKVELVKRTETRIDTKAIPLPERSKYERTKERIEVKFVPISGS